MGKRIDWWKWGWRVAPVGVIMVIGVVTDWLGRGFGEVRWLNYVLLAAGWAAGWVLADADKYLVRVQGVGTRLANWNRAVRNVLTAAVLGVVGLWVASSSGSPLAAGMVFGLAVRLFSEFLALKDYRSWYWVFARQFSEREHKIFVAIWGGILLLQWLMLVRG